MNYSKLNPVALGFTAAILAALSTFGLGLFANMFLSGKPISMMIGTVYLTYNLSVLNSLLAALVAFVNALIAGYIAAWFYNFLIKYIK
jgi:hypothetical protein